MRHEIPFYVDGSASRWGRVKRWGWNSGNKRRYKIKELAWNTNTAAIVYTAR
jgi:hypothetical protein